MTSPESSDLKRVRWWRDKSTGQIYTNYIHGHPDYSEFEEVIITPVQLAKAEKGEASAEECLEWLREKNADVDYVSSGWTVWTRGQMWLAEAKTPLEAIQNAMNSEKKK